MKGIILAGGSGTRLYPLTRAVCKQLVPVYNKPMVYYPLSTLMLAGIRDMLIITTPQDQDGIRPAARRRVGTRPARRARRAAQPGWPGAGVHHRPRRSSARDRVALALGDNIFYGHGLSDVLRAAADARARRHGVRLPRARSRALRGRRVRRRRTRAQPRGEAEAAALVVGRHGALLLRQRRARHRGLASQPSPARRTGDHRRQSPLPGTRGPAHRRASSAAATPGSTPARTSRCCRRRRSCRRSRSARA